VPQDRERRFNDFRRDRTNGAGLAFATQRGKFVMDLRKIFIVSGAALLALSATASAGPLSVASVKLIAPPQAQTQPVAYLYRHRFRPYGWDHRQPHYHHYGWRYHRYYYGWNPGPVFVGREPGVLAVPSFMATDIWPYYGYPYDPSNGYYGPDYYL
jgi:hypothetical protein